MAQMECSSFPITKEKETCTSCENCNTKRKKSHSNSWRIKRRQFDIQISMPLRINIQRLPEDIVPRITSKLTIREAAQVSVLSSMWRQACTFHPNLQFNIKTMLGSHAKKEGIHSRLGNETINKFIERVDAVLKNHSGTHVHKFAVEFGLSMEHANHINRWVLFATASKTRILVLNFSPNRIPYASDNYSFPFHLFDSQNGSYLQALQLDSIALGPSPDFCGFANLTMLAIDCVLVSQDLKHLISKCPVLEWLSIRLCYRLPDLRVPEPLCRLKYLCVQGCNFHSIEFHAPNLRTFDFECRDSLTLINLNESLKLKTATIRLSCEEPLEYMLTGIPNILPHVETLCVELPIQKEMPGHTQSPCRFIHLRHLTMEICFWGGSNSVFQLAYLLQAAPLLEDLHLTMFGLAPVFGIDLDDIMDLPHYHLKTVCITGFCGNGGEVELAKYIMKNALILEHLILKPGGKSKGSISTVYECYARQEAKAELSPLDSDGVLTIL